MLRRLGTITLALLIVVGVQLPASDANACSCFPPDLTQQVNTSDHVFRARVRTAGVLFKNSLWYRARVQRVYKGCMERGDWVLLRTASSSAACGMELDKNKTYLVTGNDDGPFYGSTVVSFGSCGYTRAWSNLNAEQKTYLGNRYNCCGDKCGCADGSAPVQCFANPCDVSTCPQGTCEANYCGGCHAEYTLDSGYGACASCTSDTDCPWSQTCSSEGQCLLGCESDDDCAATHWCRTDENLESKSCVPYAQEGESCGGYTPIWAVSKCAPALTCTDVPEFIADAPGTCRQTCDSMDDCADEQYCDTQGLCREDGGCWNADDCWSNGNGWMAPLCMGFATCDQGTRTCAWHCGEGSTCDDLGSVMFGWCEMVLGYGVVNGDCELISGCDDQGYPLFDDLAACYETCLPDLLPK